MDNSDLIALLDALSKVAKHVSNEAGATQHAEAAQLRDAATAIDRLKQKVEMAANLAQGPGRSR